MEQCYDMLSFFNRRTDHLNKDQQSNNERRCHRQRADTSDERFVLDFASEESVNKKTKQREKDYKRGK